MQVFPYEIDYYKTEDGVAPFREWFEAMRDINGRAKIRVRLDRARLGNLGDHKHLDNGVWELRVDYETHTVSILPKKRIELSCFLSVAIREHKNGISCGLWNICKTTKGGSDMATNITEYQKDLINALKDTAEAAAYLNAALEEGDREIFLLALRNVAEANGGMAAVADKAHLNRESLYRTLSRRGNPEIRTLFNLLRVVGLRLNIIPKQATA